jgi:tetratricopeptide (TPR) repeat protein
VKELTAFLKQYPDSKFENEANELVGEAYFASNNYPAAIAYIEGLKRKTPKINATYQRLTYSQGVSDFNAERYPQAVANLDKSLKFPSTTSFSKPLSSGKRKLTPPESNTIRRFRSTPASRKMRATMGAEVYTVSAMRITTKRIILMPRPISAIL